MAAVRRARVDGRRDPTLRTTNRGAASRYQWPLARNTVFAKKKQKKRRSPLAVVRWRAPFSTEGNERFGAKSPGHRKRVATALRERGAAAAGGCPAAQWETAAVSSLPATGGSPGLHHRGRGCG